MPDNASIPSTDSRRSVLAERAGRRAVALADEDVRPRDIMTHEAFHALVVAEVATFIDNKHRLEASAREDPMAGMSIRDVWRSTGCSEMPPPLTRPDSGVADRGFANRALYSASKGALQSLALAMAADLLQDGIRVNVVSPGTTDTPWVRRLLDASDDPEQQRSALVAQQPLGRLVRPAEVAHAVTYLLSPEAASTTGVVLQVDGGLAGLQARCEPAATENDAR